MEDFEIIYDSASTMGDYLRCNHCGERVERGILNVSNHWSTCKKRVENLYNHKNPVVGDRDPIQIGKLTTCLYSRIRARLIEIYGTDVELKTIDFARILKSINSESPEK